MIMSNSIIKEDSPEYIMIPLNWKVEYKEKENNQGVKSIKGKWLL